MARRLTKKTEVVVTEKNIGELKGLLASAKANGQSVAIIKVPVYMMAIDESYQTADRTARKLNYLTSRWDERKIGVLTVVPHEDEGLVYIVDGFGRWQASQIVDKEKYTTLNCAVLLDAPTDPTERRKFEAELFANQNRDVAKLKAVDKHGAFQVMEDPAALALDELQEKYGFGIGRRKYKGENAIDSKINSIYEELCKCIKSHGKEFADWYFNICKGSGFATKSHGYARYTLRTFKDIYALYPDKRDEVTDILVDYLRPITPQEFKAEAIAKYPKLDPTTACSMHLEDMVTECLGLQHTREIVSGKVIKVALVS